MGHWEWRVFFRTQQGGSEDGGAASTGSGDPGGASSASGSGDGVVSDCASDGITDHHQPDIFGKDGLHPHVEKRTDVYLSRYTSAVCGVKARGGEAHGDDAKLEVKIRTATEPGGFECWEKHKWKEHKLPEKLTARGVPYLPEDNPSSVRVVVVKKRRQRAVRTLPAGAVGEYTELVVESLGAPGAGQDGEAEQWVTVSVEGALEACREVMPVVLDRCKSAAADGLVFVMGYPEFVAMVDAAQVAKMGEERATGDNS